VEGIDKENLPEGWRVGKIKKLCLKIGSGSTPTGGKYGCVFRSHIVLEMFWRKGMDKNNPNYIGLYYFKPDNHHVAIGKNIEQLVGAIITLCRDVACRV
jgi:hypothetical protein